MIFARRFVLIHALLFVNALAFAQQTIADLLIDDNLEDIQCYANGDSVLLTFLEQIPQTNEFFRQSYWIHDNAVDTADLDLLGNHLLSGVAQHANEILYYYIREDDKKNELRAFSSTQGDSPRIILRSSEIHGDLLAVIQDENLFVLSFDNRNDELHVVEIDGNEIVRNFKYKFPYDLSYYYSGSFAVLTKNLMPTVAAGSAEFKLYKYDDNISITIDQNRIGNSSRTEIITLDLKTPGDPVFRYVPASKKIQFRSFLSNDTLYRVSITRRKISFSAHDVNSNKVVGTLRVNADDKISKHKVTRRLGHLGKIDREGDVEEFMTTSGNFFPSIVKFDNRYGSSEVVIGSYIFSHNTGSGTGGLGLGRMISYHHPSTCLQSGEPIGVSRYFHVLANNPSYTVEESVFRNSLSDKIDQYELFEVKDAIGAKAYINLPDKVIAVYALPELKKVSIVEFTK